MLRDRAVRDQRRVIVVFVLWAAFDRLPDLGGVRSRGGDFDDQSRVPWSPSDRSALDLFLFLSYIPRELELPIGNKHFDAAYRRRFLVAQVTPFDRLSYTQAHSELVVKASFRDSQSYIDVCFVKSKLKYSRSQGQEIFRF
jgi:hypothetical protein